MNSLAEYFSRPGALAGLDYVEVERGSTRLDDESLQRLSPDGLPAIQWGSHCHQGADYP
jgi:hypothetical protein